MTESYAVMRYDVNGYDADVNVNSKKKKPTTIVIITKQLQFAPMIEIYLRGAEHSAILIQTCKIDFKKKKCVVD